MWIYIWTENSITNHLWTVGFYDPEGKFHPESDHSVQESAVARVHYLNGGNKEIIE